MVPITKIAAAMAGLLLAGFATQAQALPLTIADDYWGGIHTGSYTDVVSAPSDTRFNISSATVSQIGLDLYVVINTNYSGANVGAINTNAGALFLGQLGNLNYNGGSAPNYTSDIYYDGIGGLTDDADRFSHVLDFNSNPLTGPTNANDAPAIQSGAATLFKVNAPTDVVLSFHTGSPVNNFRQFQPVDIKDSSKAAAGTGITGSWGTTFGQFTFNISDFFKVGNGLGEAAGIYSTGLTLAWAMTCANDVFMAQFAWPEGATPEVPLPAGLILLFSGLTGLGFLGRFSSRKSNAIA